jgi:hypothetical protein
VNLENWVLGNYVATLQLLVFFAEVAHEAFLLCSCVCIFICVFDGSVCMVVSRLGCTPLEVVQFTR